MHFHQHDLRHKLEKWKARSKWRQQHPVRSVPKFLTPSAPAFIVGPFIGQNVIPTIRVLRKPTNQGSAFTDIP